MTRNFADLRNYGLESELTIQPVRGFNIFWTAGLQHARFVNVDPSVLTQAANCKAGVAISTNCNQGIVTSAGNIALPSRVAPFNSTVGANYTANVGRFQIIPSVTWAYTDGSFPSAQNDPRGYQERTVCSTAESSFATRTWAGACRRTARTVSTSVTWRPS